MTAKGALTHTLCTLLRRQRHSKTTTSITTNTTPVAPLINRPPGRSMVRDHSEGDSPGRASRNATTLSPIVVPDSEWPPAPIATYCSPFYR